MKNNKIVSLYVVKSGENQYFAGFDTEKNKTVHVTDILDAKKFTNKYDIRLRPGEEVVEMLVDLTGVDVKVSSPFRPHRREKRAA